MAGYENSRMNAQRWGISVQGAIRCRYDCPYKTEHDPVCCPDGVQPVGMPCLVDLAYQRLYAESMCRAHPMLVKYRPDEFAEIVEDATRMALIRERIRVRGNRAWSLGAEKWAEMNLCDRYWTAMNNRHRRLLEQIDGLYAEVRIVVEEQKMRRLALTGHAVPEPYRSWAAQTLQCYAENRGASSHAASHPS